MTDIKLLVAMHKAYRLPENALYYPIQVGGIHIPGMEKALRDNTGENISDKNKSYCELTALYWGWKNLPADYLGLVHYRRYFAKKAWAVRSLTGSQPNYWIETTYSQYVHAHHKEDLDVVQQILTDRYPAYLPAYAAVMGRTSGHRFNMLVMRRDILDAYCTWLFDVLWVKWKSTLIQTATMHTAAVYTDFWVNGCWMCGSKRIIFRIPNCRWCFWKISTGSKKAPRFSCENLCRERHDDAGLCIWYAGVLSAGCKV